MEEAQSRLEWAPPLASPPPRHGFPCLKGLDNHMDGVPIQKKNSRAWKPYPIGLWKLK